MPAGRYESAWEPWPGRGAAGGMARRDGTAGSKRPRPLRGALRVDAWTDIVCPWCAIGRKRLHDALRDVGAPAEVVHRAFELDPRHGPSRPAREVLAERYRGRDVDAMMRSVQRLGAEEGLELRTREALSANTFDAHRLVLWAQAQGRGEPVLDAVVKAHFADLLDVADHAVLARCAEACGLDGAGARALLSGQELAGQVRSDEAEAHALGVTGVPFVAFDRRVGVAGAQDARVFRRAIEEAQAGHP